MAYKKANLRNNFWMFLSIGCLVLLGLALYLLSSQRQTLKSNAASGNEAPNGPYYNLNIIGIPKNKETISVNGNNIYVPLAGDCQIKLAQGIFGILDENCADDGIANFQLPNPDPLNTGTTTYSVWARALGKTSGESSSTTACITDPATNEVYCSVYNMVVVRNEGQNNFSTVTKDLLYVYADTGTGKIQRYPLFDSKLLDYYWQYDDDELKIMRLRFYQIPSVQ